MIQDLLEDLDLQGTRTDIATLCVCVCVCVCPSRFMNNAAVNYLSGV